MNNSYKTTRKLPKNIKPQDKILFEHELVKVFYGSETIQLKNILIDSNGTFISNKEFDKRITEKSNLYKTNDLRYILLIIKNIISLNFKIIQQKTVWFTDGWSNGYFHWILDALPRLHEAVKNNPKLKTIIPIQFNNQNYIKQSLKALGFYNVQFMKPHKYYFFRKLVFQTHLAPTGNYNELNIKSLRKTLINNIHFSYSNIEKNIYISRKKANHRKILNETELIPVLKKYGFKIINFEDYNWQEQVAISLNIEIMISLHGAGLTNMLFMPENSSVLELRRKDDDKNNCYFSLASALNINYYYLLCEVDDYTKTTQENDFYVDTDKFEKLIKQIITVS